MIYVVTNRNRTDGTFDGRSSRDGKLYRLAFNGGKTEVIRDTTWRRMILNELRDLGEKHEEAPQILVVVHGYNTNWEESLGLFKRVQWEIASKMKRPTVVVGFSWPSEGAKANYIDDRQEARVSAEVLTALLCRTVEFLRRAQCPAGLSLIAHSMGNYVLAWAAEHASNYFGNPEDQTVFSEIIMAAPDLDANALEEGRVACSIPRFARRVHVYYSRADSVLVASSIKRAGLSGARLGRSGPRPEVLSDAVASVDLTGVSRGTKSPHSAFLGAPEARRDIISVLDGVDRSEIEHRVPVGHNSWVLPKDPE